MTLNQNSFSAKLYKWFYQAEKLPDNLCPYFWKLLFAIVFSLPLIIGRTVMKLKIVGKIIIAIEFIAVGLYWLYANINLILCLCGCYYYDSFAATCAAVFDLCVIALILIVIIITTITEKEKILPEFIKAKYGKYCPKIYWIESETI